MPLLTSTLYDNQANKSASGQDSRVINRTGFTVDVTSTSGLGIRQENNPLHEGVSSHQAAMDLAASQTYVESDLFLTLTCNQSTHPGIKHLHDHKTSKRWTEFIPKYDACGSSDQNCIDRSFELAYYSVLNRCWLEVSKLLLEYIIYSKTSATGEVENAFFRLEYQKDKGNLCHIHGILALKKDDPTEEWLEKNIYDLQVSIQVLSI